MKNQIEAITACMKANHKFGTWDTEPRSVLHCLLRNALKGGEYLLEPQSWDIYSDMEGSAAIEQELDRLGRELHDSIRFNYDPIREYLDR